MAINSVVDLGCLIARDLGPSSPSTICRKVIIIKPTVIDIESIVCGFVMSSIANIGSSIRDVTGLPIQPNPSEATVIPS